MKCKCQNDMDRLIKDGWKIVHNNKHMFLFQGTAMNGYIVWNSNLLYKTTDNYGRKITHHAHINSKKIAIKMCDRIAREEIPRNIRSRWLIESYLRCSDGEYNEKLEDYFQRKEDNRKEHFINIGKKVQNRKCG